MTDVADEAARRSSLLALRLTETPRERRSAVEVMVEFRALGPVEAVVGGRVVDLGAPKQRALLALLVSSVGQRVSVDAMSEALWSGHPPPSGMTSLQAYVANLRRLLEPNRLPRTPATVLRTSPGCYLLDDGVVDVDVHRFGEHAVAGWEAWDRGDPQLALDRFDAGLALWRGQPYAEVAEASSVIPEVARLEELRLSISETRCAALLAMGFHELAVAEMVAFVQAHPLREYGCELLSRALYRAGRQADALEVLRTTNRRLVEELGINLRPALRRLESEILDHLPALDWHPIPTAPAGLSLAQTCAPAPPGGDGEAFVGRKDALQCLTAALAGATAGRGRMVTVFGEPGIGKTSLLRRFAELAGVPVLWGTCPEHVATPALWPWEQVLRAVAIIMPEQPIPRPVVELLDGATRHLVDTDVAGAALRQFETIVDYLVGASRTSPLVVLLDHLHRADSDSLRLLAHLAESVPASRLLVVVSYQSSEAAALAGTLAALTRVGIARIELAGLDVEDTRTLAGALLRRVVGVRTAERLWARTDGSPFFLRELVPLLSTEQYLEWPHTVPVPAPVLKMVLRRIERLKPGAAEMLLMAAVAGRHFDIEVVVAAASVEIEDVLEVVDIVVAAGLVIEDRERLGWYSFTHALTVEALLESAGQLRRGWLRRRICTSAQAGAVASEQTAEVTRYAHNPDGACEREDPSPGLSPGAWAVRS